MTNATPGTSSFDDFWKIWPRKVARKAAEKAWRSAVKRSPYETIIAAAASYAASREGKDQTFTAHASTWLNGDRWEDQKQLAETASPGEGKTSQDQFYRDWINKGRNAGAWVSEQWVRLEIRAGRINAEMARKAGHST